MERRVGLGAALREAKRGAVEGIRADKRALCRFACSPCLALALTRIFSFAQRTSAAAVAAAADGFSSSASSLDQILGEAPPSDDDFLRGMRSSSSLSSSSSRPRSRQTMAPETLRRALEKRHGSGEKDKEKNGKGRWVNQSITRSATQRKAK